MSQPKYYPKLSDLINSENIPGDFLILEDFAQNAIDFVLGGIRYSKYNIEHSNDGDTVFYSLSILTKKIKLPLPGELNLIFFDGINGYSEFPINFEWTWPLKKYINEFDVNGFSHAPEAFLNILLELADIESPQEILQEIINVFIGNSSALNNFHTILSGDLTTFATNNTPVATVVQNINTQITAIKTEVDSILSGTSGLSLSEIAEGYENNATIKPAVDSILNSIEVIENNSNDFDLYPMLIKPALNTASNLEDKFSQLFDLFRSWLGEIGREDIEELLIPQFKVELSNINLALEFPRDWLIPAVESPAASGHFIESTTLTEFSSLTFNVGTLRYSTTTGFEFLNQNSFTFQRSFIGKTGLQLSFTGLKVDLSKTKNIAEAIADGRPDDFQGVYAEEATVTLPEKWFKDQAPGATAEIFGRNLLIGTGGISGTIGLEAIGTTTDPKLTYSIGSNDGFKVDFRRFDISFKQNKIISSSISGGMLIEKFKYPAGSPKAGDPVYIDIDAHIQDNGDFNLTASAKPPYPIEVPGVFKYHIDSLGLGKEGDEFYLETSGSIELLGTVKDLLKLKAIKVEKLRIYSDGSIDIQGGSIALQEPIIASLGPVELTVSAIHIGSDQKEVNGKIRKFSYFGLDGGLKVDPLGVEIRGDGVKFFYCSDNEPVTAAHPWPKPYLQIKTIRLDLTIPSGTPAAIISGWLTIPEPGVSKEYAGGISLEMPQAQISGKADMKLMPKEPAFVIDAQFGFPIPIPLGPFAIYEFRGLLGYRYVAEKSAVFETDADTKSWFDYYKANPRGIHVTKFNGPDKTKQAGTPFAIGAGASMGTAGDNGTVLNLKAMVLLSIPSLFMISGKAAIISARMGLEDTTEPPFFAFVAVGDDSLEFGFGADFTMETKAGDIVVTHAEIQAGFFFKDKSKWYVNIGTRENPVNSRVLELMTITAYLMLSAKGMEAGARAEFSFKREYSGGVVKVDAFAYIELGGKISFERPQFGAYLQAGVNAEVNIKVVSLYAAFDILFGVEGSKPYKIYGEFRFCVKIKIAYVFKFEFCGNLSVSWEFNKSIDTTPVDPMINEKNKTTKKIDGLVKGVSMLSNETFDLVHFENAPTTLDPAITDKIIPLDTFIDIKMEKGLLPKGNVSTLIGGLTNPPKGYIENVPPQKVMKGKVLRQVKHQYSIEEISVKSWNPTTSTWEDYHPYQAMDPSDSSLSTYKIGQFQKSGKEYNTIRLLATSPFSFTAHGPSNWNIPEQNGISAATLFCEGEKEINSCANFELKPLNQKYHCYDSNHAFSANEASFLLIDKTTEEFAEVVDETNSHGLNQSLAFNNHNTLQITLPEPSVNIGLKLSSHSQKVTVRYYADVTNYFPTIGEPSTLISYGHPDITNTDPYFEDEVIAGNLNQIITYDHPTWLPVIKIEIIPESSNRALIEQLREDIASINQQNKLIELELETGSYQSTFALQEQIDSLSKKSCSSGEEKLEDELCLLYKALLAISPCLTVNENEDPDLNKIRECAINVISILTDFDQVYRSHDVLNVYGLEIQSINNFIENPNMETYNKMINDFNKILSHLSKNSDCGCKKDTELCEQYQLILTKRNDSLPDPRQLNEDTDLNNLLDSVTSIIEEFKGIGNDEVQRSIERESNNSIIEDYLNDNSRENYAGVWSLIQDLLELLKKAGNCDCDDKKCHTLFHEICWLSVDQYQYNINIPSQAEILADTTTTVNNIKNNIQPVWRPNTSYYVNFRLRDTVLGTATDFDDYTYGFTTAGPVGYFHTDEKATYGDYKVDPLDPNSDIVEDANGILKDYQGNLISPQPTDLKAYPEKYPLTTISQYIDYKRSYPNADGNLLSAKPLFYNDETTKVDLFFVKTYAKYFFKNWDSYNGNNAIDGRIKVVIKDPREKAGVKNPPEDIDDPSKYLSNGLPQGLETWEADLDPIESHAESKYLNLAKENNCTVIGGIESVKPKADMLKVELANLKPQKLYTAIVNNMFDLNEDGSFDVNTSINEIREVHKFVFQTSRYATFKEQVNSYILSNPDLGPDTKNAIFNIEKTIPQADLTAVWDTISGNPNTISDGLKTKYQHAFDRVVEGVFGITPIHEPISTEFNVIKSNDKIVALLIKNPEPFNNPKIPLDVVSDTIQILDSSGSRDTDYEVLYSKDYSQAIIMHSSFEIANVLDIQFQYKVWDGTEYKVPKKSTPTNPTIYSDDKVGTITIQNLNLINN